MVESGNKCLEIVFSNTAEDDNNNYDISGFEVARKIRDRLPTKDKWKKEYKVYLKLHNAVYTRTK